MLYLLERIAAGSRCGVVEELWKGFGGFRLDVYSVHRVARNIW